MHAYSKSVAVIQGADDDDKFGPNGGFSAILSTPSLDRDGDRLYRNEWMEPLPDRLPLDIDHGMSVADTVGSFHPYFDGDTLMMDAYFASTPKAQETRTLVNEGHIRNVSIAFMTDKSRKDGEPRREVLNAGIVSTPSNRDAVILASKAINVVADLVPGFDDEQREKLIELLNIADSKAALSPGGGGDAALTQAIHDASVHLGAICIQMVPDVDPTGTADGANKSFTGISFANEAGEKVNFDDPAAARAFFTEMLKSLDDADAAGETLVEVAVDDTPAEPTTVGSMTLEQFHAALAQYYPQPESPVEEVPAETATDEVPVVEAATETAADDVVDPTQIANHMLMQLFATSN